MKLIIFIMENNNSKQRLIGILELLSKQEIADIIIKDGSIILQNKFFEKYMESFPKDKEASNKTLNDIKSRFEWLCDDREILYSPDSFDRELTGILEWILYIWEQNLNDIKEFIIEIIERIDNLQDEWYLYDDYYDWCFEGIEFSSFLIKLISTFSSIAKIDIIMSLLELIPNMSYSTISISEHDILEILSVEDRTIFKWKIKDISNLSPFFYSIIHDILTDEEKIKILSSQYEKMDDMTLDLAQVYITKKDIEKAKEILDRKLKNANSDVFQTWSLEIYEQRVKITVDNEEKLNLLKKMIANNPFEFSLTRALQYINNDNNKIELEEILASKSISDYANYLEHYNRPDEVIEIIKSWKLKRETFWFSQFDFFSKYGNLYKIDAIKYYQEYIKSNSMDTKDYHYDNIVNAIEEIRKIDIETFKKECDYIRNNFSRRRNLIEKLNSKFWKLIK